MTDIQDKIRELRRLIEASGIDAADEVARLEQKLKDGSDLEKVWRQVELARHPDRPYPLDYIERIFDGFIELHGDRAYADDPAVVGGIGFLAGRPVTVIAQQKGRTLKENVRRNHGMANPEGYRKSLRLARAAEKFRRPIVTFIDTSGAYPGIGSEERGVAQAIALSLRDFSQLLTPVVCVIVGEGGSGGALAVCIGDRIHMLENAICSVISPEGCASILLRDATKAKEAARMLKITSADLAAFRMISGVIPEPEGGAHLDPDGMAAAIKEILVKDLDELCGKKPEVLVRRRNHRIWKLGQWIEEGPASEE
ncbi:MAG: acetyl-CoA carboxylase carboxyltransferase subunit alpha [Treponema sp.]|nr:acetyl-CoA carboxylase carboxyltransferase subunit alpha [Treponema sp.]